MRRSLLALIGLAAVFGFGSADAQPRTSGSPTAYRSTVSVLGPSLRNRMTGVSWHPGCPVPLRDLRLVTVTRWGFDGKSRTGKLVVHRDVAADVASVFRSLYEAGYPVRRMRLIDRYGGSDFESIEDDNTSAFNCRRATGSGRWSQHAYGRAIDLNPIENPYVEGGRVYHAASRRYVDRSRRLEGMIHPGDAVVRAFERVGWGWGGYWTGSVKDYQHFSVSGG
jgi:hypothetical protein